MAMTFAGSTPASQVARGINVLLGVWLFISAFIWSHTMAEQTNTWILGALCVLFALISLSEPPARWLSAILAVWLFISVWALPHHSLATMWNNALVAIAVFVLSLIPSPRERTLATGHAPA